MAAGLFACFKVTKQQCMHTVDSFVRNPTTQFWWRPLTSPWAQLSHCGFHTARQATKHAFQMLASAMKNSEGKTFHWAPRQLSTPAALRSDTGEQARMLDGTTNKGPVVKSSNNPHQARAPCRSRQTFCQDPACI